MQKKPSWNVIRINNETYQRLKSIKKEHMSFNDIINASLDVSMNALDSKPLFLVGEKLYNDILDARGEAISIAAQTKSKMIKPKILIEIGEDTI